jgi:RsmE family RNA methyltransferase
MNLLLLTPGDLLPDGTALLTGRRARHAHEVLRAQAKDALRIGVRDGRVGHATVLHSTRDELRLEVHLDAEPPPRPGVSLLLAMPRPKALKKVLPAVASLGLEQVILVNAARVEKSYFDSKVLDQVDDWLALGLEQAKDTVAPRVTVAPRFRPFVEDELDASFATARRLLAHPTAAQTPAGLAFGHRQEPLLVAVGPEGGWVPFEEELLTAHGFTPFSLGQRTLRVEVAVPFALGQLLACRDRA